MPAAAGGAAALAWMDHMTKKAKSLAALALILGAITITACNTVEGVGEDVKETGKAIEKTAEETNDDDPNTP